MGQLHFSKINLTQLIQFSSHIIVAVPIYPFVVMEQVDIKHIDMEVPPYIRQVQCFRVQESLRGNLEPGIAIEVIPARDVMSEHMHRDYYIIGLSRHVMVDRYDNVSPYEADGPRILFLRINNLRYEYAVEGGAEGLSYHSEILFALGGQQ